MNVAIKRRNLAQRVWRSKHLYLYILPVFVFLGLLLYYPVATAFIRAFYEWDGVTSARYIGFANFIEIFRDSAFHTSMKNVAIILLFHLIVPTFIPLLVAEAIFGLTRERAGNVFKTLLIMPAALPPIVLIMLFQYIVDPYDGIANQILVFLGFEPLLWLSSPKLALPTVLLLGFPWAGGLWMLIYLAGLQNISESVLDSALLEGAGRLRRFFLIDVPLVAGQIRLVMTIMCIMSMQGFMNVLILTRGGPGGATFVPGLLLYLKAFDTTWPQNPRLGYSCAMGVILFVMIMLLSQLVIKRIVKSKVDW
jgi:raffinose/stachyose/melibiose transport system permease protein